MAWLGKFLLQRRINKLRRYRETLEAKKELKVRKLEVACNNRISALRRVDDAENEDIMTGRKSGPWREPDNLIPYIKNEYADAIHKVVYDFEIECMRVAADIAKCEDELRKLSANRK
jgi:hypothetical protein